MSKIDLNLSLGSFRGWFKKATCPHPIAEQDFVENIGGERIRHFGGMRSIWRCRKCGEEIYKPDLFTPPK